MTPRQDHLSLVLPSPPVGVRYLHQRSHEAGFVDGVHAVFSETLGYDDRPAGDALADLQRRLAIAERAEQARASAAPCADLPDGVWDMLQWINEGDDQ